MSRKRTHSCAEFKSQLELEVLTNEKTLAEIAMEPSKAVKEYKEELSAAHEQHEMLTKIVGN